MNMKKKIIALIAGIIMISVGFSTIASADQRCAITGISASKQGIVAVIISNDGSDVVDNISVDVTITYGVLKRTMSFGSDGLVLSPDCGVVFSTLGQPIFGFGKISIHAEVSHSLGGGRPFIDDSRTVNGFIFFHRIILSNQDYPL
jgi:hypothetical protein